MLNSKFQEAEAFAVIIPLCNPIIKREAILHLFGLIKAALK